jgi:hypothetical protein
MRLLFALFGWTTRYHVSVMWVDKEKSSYSDCVVTMDGWLCADNLQELREVINNFYQSKPTILGIYKL